MGVNVPLCLPLAPSPQPGNQTKMKTQKIRARLTIYNHEELKGSKLAFFRKWIKAVAQEMQTQKPGELSKVFRATLYK